MSKPPKGRNRQERLLSIIVTPFDALEPRPNTYIRPTRAKCNRKYANRDDKAAEEEQDSWGNRRFNWSTQLSDTTNVYWFLAALAPHRRHRQLFLWPT